VAAARISKAIAFPVAFPDAGLFIWIIGFMLNRRLNSPVIFFRCRLLITDAIRKAMYAKVPLEIHREAAFVTRSDVCCRPELRRHIRGYRRPHPALRSIR
jgi:hypothetical protein